MRRPPSISAAASVLMGAAVFCLAFGLAFNGAARGMDWESETAFGTGTYKCPVWGDSSDTAENDDYKIKIVLVKKKNGGEWWLQGSNCEHIENHCEGRITAEVECKDPSASFPNGWEAYIYGGSGGPGNTYVDDSGDLGGEKTWKRDPGYNDIVIACDDDTEHYYSIVLKDDTGAEILSADAYLACGPCEYSLP